MGLRTNTIKPALATVLVLAAVMLAGGGSSGGVSFAAPSSGGIAGTGLNPQQLFPIGGPDLVRAQTIAIKYWNANPCGGAVTITWGTLAQGQNALSNWWNPVSSYGNAQANNRCQTTLSVLVRFDWPMLCSVIVHEYGHLTGHAHTTDPNSVMYPYYTHPIAQCGGTSSSTASSAATGNSAVRRQAATRSHHKTHAARHRRHHRKASRHHG